MTGEYLSLLLALGGAIFLGVATQRISGVGFAQVASPFLVFLLGPVNGILIINVFGSLTALTVFLQVIKLVEFRRAFLMMIPAVLAIIPGSWVALHMRSELLSILIGVMIIAALVGSLLVREALIFQGRSGAILAGSISGFMNVTAGVGGPALTAYAVATKWPQASFAATAQLYFFGVGVFSLLAKHSLPVLDSLQWLTCIFALAIGIIAGNFIAPRVPARVGRTAVIALAFVGAGLILAKGLITFIVIT
jgi:uncharacterized membrane protein YfcA